MKIVDGSMEDATPRIKKRRRVSSGPRSQAFRSSVNRSRALVSIVSGSIEGRLSGEDPELHLVGVGMRLSQPDKSRKPDTVGASGDRALSDVDRNESPSGETSEGEQMAA